jgi:predicted GNAT superfamily acetyltransferase
MLVRWQLRSDLAVAAWAAAKRPAASADEERARGAVVALSAGPDGRPVTTPPVGGPGARTLLVGVPADVEAMRATDPHGAAQWRSALRNVLAPLLAGGARVTGFDKAGWYVVML